MDSRAGARTRPNKQVTTLHREGAVMRKLTEHETRIKALEDSVTDISEIKEAVFKIVKYVRIGLPSIISAAIAAGVVNGKLGAFLNALFH